MVAVEKMRIVIDHRDPFPEKIFSCNHFLKMVKNAILTGGVFEESNLKVSKPLHQTRFICTCRDIQRRVLPLEKGRSVGLWGQVIRL